MAMPRTKARVVCTFCVTAATFAPTSVFTSVDLPAFGAPSTAMTAQRCSAIDAILLQKRRRGCALRIALLSAFTARCRKARHLRLDNEMWRVFRAGTLYLLVR